MAVKVLGGINISPAIIPNLAPPRDAGDPCIDPYTIVTSSVSDPGRRIADNLELPVVPTSDIVKRVDLFSNC